ncbi:Delta-cadinene synthase isozyme A [Hibiscus syriacus]|uniref:Delta-cadinene synthase isozyme A n=1 Tax=Hibiscus syriacus TaxID=106335 RepID=A0A6A2WUF8_HIBSY|nr:Delta-cadinene synthase isozyme A [Hibiscus syriacus]
MVASASKSPFRHLIPSFSGEKPRNRKKNHLHGREFIEGFINGGFKETVVVKMRVGICIGAARGLEFLRSGTPSIIHRDIKSSNFLLDKNWFPRISDFEISRFVPTRSGTDSHVSTVVAGTMGYLDPEYVRTGHLTMKSDVYSFGVVLFEVLSARKPMERTIIQPTVMQRWRQCVEDDRIGEILDPRMKDEVAPECLTAYTNIAYKCVNNRGSERPTMADVVKRLEQILLFQECFEADVPFSPSWPLSETEFQVSDMSKQGLMLSTLTMGHLVEHGPYKCISTDMNCHNVHHSYHCSGVTTKCENWLAGTAEDQHKNLAALLIIQRFHWPLSLRPGSIMRMVVALVNEFTLRISHLDVNEILQKSQNIKSEKVKTQLVKQTGPGARNCRCSAPPSTAPGGQKKSNHTEIFLSPQ